MVRLFLFVLFSSLAALPTIAAQATGDLVVEDVEIVEALNIYGLPQTSAHGQLVNTGEAAYTNISLTGLAFAADGTDAVTRPSRSTVSTKVRRFSLRRMEIGMPPMETPSIMRQANAASGKRSQPVSEPWTPPYPVERGETA